VVYPFTVENTGNTTDSYTLTVANDDWPTEFSSTSVGLLGPSETATFYVTVTVPANATPADFDTAEVTATSVGNAAESDTSTIDTGALPFYALDLWPDSDSRTDSPDEVVTYTLVVYNNGNMADTYDLAMSAAAWPTTISQNTIGPVDPGDYGSFEVYVTIPSSASDGDSDVVTITATSAGSSLPLSDASPLTTIASTQPITRGVELNPPSASKIGNPGEAIAYQLTVVNTGSLTDTIALQASGDWPAEVYPPLAQLPSMGQATVFVTVTIPLTATNGDDDLTTVTANGAGAVDSSTLTTIATTQPITRGVELAPATATQSGGPGEVLVYHLTVTNTGSVTDIITLAVGPSVWATGLAPQQVTLGSGESAAITVTVAIPTAALGGASDTVIITAQGTGASDTATLTSMVAAMIYLPIIFKVFTQP
jgi:uncharacterized membrane protein